MSEMFLLQSPSPVMCPSPEYMFSPYLDHQDYGVPGEPAPVPVPVRGRSAQASPSPGPYGAYFVAPPVGTPPAAAPAYAMSPLTVQHPRSHILEPPLDGEQGPSTADIIAAQGQDYVDEKLAEYQATILLLQGRLPSLLQSRLERSWRLGPHMPNATGAVNKNMSGTCPAALKNDPKLSELRDQVTLRIPCYAATS